MKSKKRKSKVDWKNEIKDWAVVALEKIKSGKFRPKEDTKALRNLYKKVDREDRLNAVIEIQKYIDAAAFSVFQETPETGSRLLDPKLTKYYGQLLTPVRCRLQKSYGRWFIQKMFSLLTGRMLTQFGALRLYAFASVGFTLLFAVAFYLLGIEWTNDSCKIIGPIQYIYFSGTTLATLGYGDLHPISSIGQVVAIIEALAGYLLLGLGVFSISHFLSSGYTPSYNQRSLEKLVQINDKNER